MLPKRSPVGKADFGRLKCIPIKICMVGIWRMLGILVKSGITQKRIMTRWRIVGGFQWRQTAVFVAKSKLWGIVGGAKTEDCANRNGAGGN